MPGVSICKVCKQFTEAGFMADSDLDSGCLLNKKIRNAQLAQYNFILGEKTYFPYWPLIGWHFSPILLHLVFLTITSEVHLQPILKTIIVQFLNS